MDLLNKFSPESKEKRQLLGDVLGYMRNDKYDVRKFNFKYIVKFIKTVGDLHPKELQVFKNYMDQAIL